MDKLIAGFHRFRKTRYRKSEEVFVELAQRGQSPHAAVIACCDSRVDPQMIFDAGPGELFVVRNVANLVPPYQPDADYHGTSAALEFAVRGLKVDRIVVLGHAQCGGIAALIDDGTESDGDFIGHWMKIAAPARAKAKALAGHDHHHGPQREAELEGIKVSLGNLMTFPWIRERVEAGTLTLHGAYYELLGADLLCLDPETGLFTSVAATETAAADTEHS
jgi:carbonic anhydrase